MKVMIANLVRVQAAQIATVTDDARTTETTVLRRKDGVYAVVRVKRGRMDCTVEWCHSPSALFGVLSRQLGAGDFALMGWRLLGKVH